MSKDNNKKPIKHKATYLLTGLAVFAIVFSATIAERNDLSEGEKTKVDFSKVEVDTTYGKTDPNNYATPTPAQEELELNMELNFEQDNTYEIKAQGTNVNEFIKYNPRTVATIGIPGTTLFFPVVDSADDKEWLHKNFDNNDSAYGAIFLDYLDNKEFLDKVSTIFGHNMKDKRMFAGLNRYINDKEYYKSSMYAFISTKDYIHIYRFAFASRVPSDVNEIRKGNYRTGEKYTEFIDFLETYSKVTNEEVDVHDSEKLLQLLTCCGKKELRTAVYFSYVDSIPNILNKQDITEENQELIKNITRRKNNYSDLSQNVLGYTIYKNMDYIYIDNLIGAKYIWTEKELSNEEKEAFLKDYDFANKENYTFMYGYNTFNLNYIYVNISERDNSYLLICKGNIEEDEKGNKNVITPIYVRSGKINFSYKEKDSYTLDMNIE